LWILQPFAQTIEIYIINFKTNINTIHYKSIYINAILSTSHATINFSLLWFALKIQHTCSHFFTLFAPKKKYRLTCYTLHTFQRARRLSFVWVLLRGWRTPCHWLPPAVAHASSNCDPYCFTSSCRLCFPPDVCYVWCLASRRSLTTHIWIHVSNSRFERGNLPPGQQQRVYCFIICILRDLNGTVD
jgi:hypothetical protein